MSTAWIRRTLAPVVIIVYGVRAGADDIISNGATVMSDDSLLAWVFVGATGAAVCVLTWMYVACRRRANARELCETHRQDFSTRLMHSQEEERKRIAHELHDSLGQDLLLIKTSAELALGELESAVQLRKRLNQITSVAGKAVQDVRAITNDLRPPELDRLGLAAAVESMAERVSRNTVARLECGVASLDHQLAKQDEINLYRMIQECLTNSLKHSDATRIQICARRINGDLNVHVADNGKGFDRTAVQGSEGRMRMGLVGLAERARNLGGRLLIESTPGDGTRVTLAFPVKHHEFKSNS